LLDSAEAHLPLDVKIIPNVIVQITICAWGKSNAKPLFCKGKKKNT